MSPLAAHIFAIAQPTLHAQLTAEALKEVLEGEPQRERLSPEDVNILAGRSEEVFTEGRVHRHDFRRNFKE